MDIIIPYLNNGSDELRYTLRAIERHVPHGKIIISGDCPDWATNITYVPRVLKYPAQLDSEMNIIAGLAETTGDFILFNDDIITLKDVDEIPSWHEGDIEYVIQIKKQRAITSPTVRHLQITASALEKLYNIIDPLAYTLHAPVVMNKDKYLTMAQDTVMLLKTHQPILPRTIYGNLHQPDSAIHRDCKLYGKDDPLPDDYFVSTHEGLMNGTAGQAIKTIFSNKCKYEVQ